jgi:hypothetical protein
MEPCLQYAPTAGDGDLLHNMHPRVVHIVPTGTPT